MLQNLCEKHGKMIQYFFVYDDVLFINMNLHISNVWVHFHEDKHLFQCLNSISFFDCGYCIFFVYLES